MTRATPSRPKSRYSSPKSWPAAVAAAGRWNGTARELGIRIDKATAETGITLLDD
jgi:hypothetical protein